MAGGCDESGAIRQWFEAVPGHPGVRRLGVGGVGSRAGQAWRVQGEKRLQCFEITSDLGQQRRSEPVYARSLCLAAERCLGLEQAIEQMILPGVPDERLG